MSFVRFSLPLLSLALAAGCAGRARIASEEVLLDYYPSAPFSRTYEWRSVRDDLTTARGSLELVVTDVNFPKTPGGSYSIRGEIRFTGGNESDAPDAPLGPGAAGKDNAEAAPDDAARIPTFNAEVRASGLDEPLEAAYLWQRVLGPILDFPPFGRFELESAAIDDMGLLVLEVEQSLGPGDDVEYVYRLAPDRSLVSVEARFANGARIELEANG